jgi:putative transposase
LKPAVRERLRTLFNGICEKAGCRLVGMEGTDIHVCLLVAMHPSVMPSRLVNTLKTISSRVIRKEFPEILVDAGTSTFLWHRSYGLTSVNGVSAEHLLKHLQSAASEGCP